MVVYRLVTAQSVDVHIIKTADGKRSLEKLVLHGGAASSGGKRRRREVDGGGADTTEERALRALLRPEFDVRHATALCVFVCECVRERAFVCEGTGEGEGECACVRVCMCVWFVCLSLSE